MFKKILILSLILTLLSNTSVFADSKTSGVKSTYSKTKRLTPKEKEIRKQMFNNAVQNGGKRAKYYNIYY